MQTDLPTIDHTQPQHLIAAEQNFRQGYTLHIHHVRRHCGFRRRWGLGSLFCSYAHALEILDELQETYPSNFKITGERHREAPFTQQRASTPIAPKPEVPMTPSTTEVKPTVTPPPEPTAEIPAEPPETIALTEPAYTSTELAELTGISGRRIHHLKHDDGVSYTKDADGILHFQTDTRLIKALFDRFDLRAEIALIAEEPGKGEQPLSDIAAAEYGEVLPDAVAFQDLQITIHDDELPSSPPTGYRHTAEYQAVHLGLKAEMKHLVDAFFDGETALITHHQQAVKEIEDDLLNDGTRLKRDGEKLLNLASQSRQFRQFIGGCRP